MLRPSIRFLLWAAVIVPVLYFGAQLLAAPCFADYSVFTVTASELGSNRSTCPAIFNAGTVLTGTSAALGARGLWLTLARSGVGRLPAALFAACVAWAGLAFIWGGLHPLPSPIHEPAVLGVGIFAVPLAATLVAWRLPNARLLLVSLVLNVLAFAAVGLVMADSTTIDQQRYGALFKKVFALICLFPIAAIALTLLNRADGRASNAR